MQIYYKHWIHIQKYLSENMSYRGIAQKINISKSAVFYEIKTKSINDIYKAKDVQYLTEKKRYYANHQRAKYHNIEIMTQIEKCLKMEWSLKAISLYLKNKNI